MSDLGDRRTRQDDGFMLVGLIAAIFIILLIVAIAAPRVAKSLRRDRELEAIHRGNQYVRAVQLYYRKLGHYPSNLDQLEKTNNIRFLRQRYVDPMTGKPDWRLIHVGEAKTTVKGFFGKPLSGLQNGVGIAGAYTPGTPIGANGSGSNTTSSSGSTGSSFGSSSGSSSFGGSGTGANSGGSGFGGTGSSSSTFGNGAAYPGAGQTGSPNGTAAAGSNGTGTTGFGSTGTNGVGSQSASTFTGGGAPIVGVSSMASGSSITVLNEQTTYATWEFLYDPRIEQLKAKTSLLGGPVNGTSASSFGSGTGSNGTNGTAAPGSSPSFSNGGGATTPSAPANGTSPGSPPPQ